MVLPPTPLQNVLQCCDSSSNAIVKRSVLYVSINLCCAGSVCWYYGLHVCRQKYINIIQPQFYASVFTTSHMVFHCKTLVYSEWHDQKMCNTNMAYNKISDSTKCRCGKIIYEPGLHGLSCTECAGQFPRYLAISSILKRALSLI